MLKEKSASKSPSSRLGMTQRKKRIRPEKLTVNPKFALQPDELAAGRTHHRPASQEAKQWHSQAILGHRAKKSGRKAKASARSASEGSWWLQPGPREGFTAAAQRRTQGEGE